MFKYVFLLVLSFSASAYQTKQEIIDYCTRVMLKDGGNAIVLVCIQQELEARDKIEELAKS